MQGVGLALVGDCRNDLHNRNLHGFRGGDLGLRTFALVFLLLPKAQFLPRLSLFTAPR